MDECSYDAGIVFLLPQLPESFHSLGQWVEIRENSIDFTEENEALWLTDFRFMLEYAS